MNVRNNVKNWYLNSLSNTFVLAFEPFLTTYYVTLFSKVFASQSVTQRILLSSRILCTLWHAIYPIKHVHGFHDDVIKWKHFPRYWPFVRGIHRSPVTGEFHAQRPVTRSFDVFFDLRLNKWLSKQSWGRWFETLSRPLWRHCNDGFDFFFLVLYTHILKG